MTIFMQCHIYRSSIKAGLYVYLADKEGLEQLPDAVRKQLGTPEFAMSLDLTPDRKLGQEDTATVLANLESRGFHVQMPKEIESVLQIIADDVTRKQRNQ